MIFIIQCGICCLSRYISDDVGSIGAVVSIVIERHTAAPSVTLPVLLQHNDNVHCAADFIGCTVKMS